MQQASSENWETGSGQTGPAYEAGLVSALAERENGAVRYETVGPLVHQSPDSHRYLFSLFNKRPTKVYAHL